jgi:AcrR family transcriptional regulator
MGSSARSNPDPASEQSQSLPRAYAIRSERERLLEAMVRTVAARGYESTTVAEVTDLAGLPVARFGELFDSKEACFLEAYDAVVDVLIAHVSAAYESAGGEPWPERIAAALRAMLELLAAEADIARMAIVEVTAVGEDARIRFRAALERFVPFLEAGRPASSQGDELPPGTARFAIGAVIAMIFDEVRAGRGPELPRILPELAFAVLTPYLGPEAAEAEMRRLGEGG